MKSKRFLAVLLILSLAAALMPLTVAADPPAPVPSRTGEANLQRSGLLATGTLWENGEWDGVNALNSQEGGYFGIVARAADDFQLDQACPLYAVERIRGQLWTYGTVPDALTEIYADSGGNGPLDPPLYSFAMTSSEVVGSAYGYTIVEYTFETPGLTLAPGHYWVSVAGVNPVDWQTFFATAGNGVLQLQEGYFKSDFFGAPSWVPAGPYLGGVASDFAFDLDGGCACEPPTNVDFAWDPAAPYMGDLVTFQATAAGTEPITYEWDLGDGTTGSGQTVTHTYLLPLCYTVTLTATNACGTATVEHTVTVRVLDTVLHVHTVDLMGIGQDPFLVRARVQIRDQYENVVPGAQVLVQLLMPMKLRAGIKLTNPNGIALFNMQSRWGGYWEICVVNVTKSGAVYWPWSNEETCAELTWPPQP